VPGARLVPADARLAGARSLAAGGPAAAEPRVGEDVELTDEELDAMLADDA
jgi:hypothetical protein